MSVAIPSAAPATLKSRLLGREQLLSYFPGVRSSEVSEAISASRPRVTEPCTRRSTVEQRERNKNATSPR